MSTGGWTFSRWSAGNVSVSNIKDFVHEIRKPTKHIGPYWSIFPAKTSISKVRVMPRVMPLPRSRPPSPPREPETWGEVLEELYQEGRNLNRQRQFGSYPAAQPGRHGACTLAPRSSRDQ